MGLFEILPHSKRTLIPIFWILLDHLVEDGADQRRDLEGRGDRVELRDGGHVDGDMTVNDGRSGAQMMKGSEADEELEEGHSHRVDV